MIGEVLLETAGPVARVTLSHPGKHNAMSRLMWRELRDVFQQIQRNGSIASVVIGGQDHFCAGGDISEYAGFRFNEMSLREFHENDVWGGLQAMLDCDVPIVAQVAGNCMGAGVEIASCCDIRIAGTSARFGAPIARLGFPMAPREAALVLRAVGELTARQMLLSAAVLDAQEMWRRGFLNLVVSDQSLGMAASDCVQNISQLAPHATRLNKQTFRALINTSDSQITSGLSATAYQYADSAEHREGVMAFVQKRSPYFTP